MRWRVQCQIAATFGAVSLHRTRAIHVKRRMAGQKYRRLDVAAFM
jgi:hypothetical protein